MSEDFVIEVFDLDSIGDEIASEDVAKSGLQIRTLPAGKYQMGIDKMEGRKLPDNARTNPNRRLVNIAFQDPDTKRKVFCNVSWEPGEESGDKENQLYSQLELALQMTGEPVRDVLAVAKDSKFTVELIETCRLEVGDLPEDKQNYYVNTKGLGIGAEVTVYLKPEEDEFRQFLLMNQHQLKNYIKSLGAPVE